jgi:hypothetical protein
MEDNASQPTKQVQLSPTHSGNGGLRGGGVKQRLVRDETLVRSFILKSLTFP